MKASTILNISLLQAVSNLYLVEAASTEEEPILLLSEDPTFHFEILGGLGQAIGGGSDIAPLLAAAKDIKVGDFETFSGVLFNLANKTKAQALDPTLAFDPINVRDTWFSVANYFRRADAFSKGNWDNPIIKQYWNEQLAAFNKGLAALPIPGERVQIPADNFTVEAIWYSADKDKKKRPTLIIGNGYDAAQEDMYHIMVVHAQAIGWNALTYEGPGQPTVRRSQDLGFIPDWERVLTPAVDYVLNEKSDEVDTERLALYGNSMGGYLAARAAAFEPRIKAVALNGGVFSVHDSYKAQLPDDLSEIYEAGKKEEFDQVALSLLAPNSTAPTSIRWGLEQGLWAFKTKSPYEFFKKTEQYTLEGITDRINMPVWIADAEFEGFFKGEPQRVKDALGDKATFHLFSGEAGYHTQSGAFQEMTRVIFGWLHQTLG
ncbi:unnamed protein product [Clonostachys rhizophaga]|uniref:Peptidase S9 prolyl oligopeptidase catalytic domain-containing protein n=1 Tax=Clonostachys rhizophaga TaxID=160324 RepID=A0A9N9VBI5_9HYPO|nr:unnamed protein product [Clonostachys rhizophaga]